MIAIVHLYHDVTMFLVTCIFAFLNYRYCFDGLKDVNSCYSADDNSYEGMREDVEIDGVIIIPLEGVILFPGNTIPLRLKRDRYSLLLNSKMLIGIVCMQASGTELETSNMSCSIGNKVVAKIGTTCSIVKVSDQNSSFNTNGTSSSDDNEYILLTAKGITRFEIKSASIVNGLITAQVLLLTEIYTEGPMWRYSEANVFPKQLYYSMSPFVLVDRIKCLLNANFISTNSAFPPEIFDLDPVQVYFYISSNLPMKQIDRLQLLFLSGNVNVRLLKIANYLEVTASERYLCCSRCKQMLALKSSIFKVEGSEGACSAYVNAHAYVHQTITVKHLLSNVEVVVSGTPSSQDCWFPGYLWQVLCCSMCFNHLGWLYRATHIMHPTSRLSHFFGMRREALTEIHCRDSV